MRLINTSTIAIREFLSEDRIPPFAILSHTWGDEECTLQQMDDPVSVMLRAGYAKIELSCKQALRDGLEWVWVDTCCIDKTSTAELSEAINSMFRWYRNAKICYAYLSDVGGVGGLPTSRWFTRGWTLQELVAPDVIHFYTCDWQFLGSKQELSTKIWDITGIEEEVLSTGNLDHVNIARKMSWAANRQTTRVEDQTYCLLGLFNVNIPLLYGEGPKAFKRLQEELMKVSDDQSLFAWGLPKTPKSMQDFLNTYADSGKPSLHGPFASSPLDFTFSHLIRVIENPYLNRPPILSNNGVRIELQLAAKSISGSGVSIAALLCTMEGKYECYIGIPLVAWGRQWTARIGELVLVHARDVAVPDADTPYGPLYEFLIKQPSSLYTQPISTNMLKIVGIDDIDIDYLLEDVECSPHVTYSAVEQTIALPSAVNRLHAAMFFVPRGSANPNRVLQLLDEGFVRQRLRADYTLQCIRPRSNIQLMCGAPQARTGVSFTQPPFAILIGGTMTAPWVTCVPLLSDEDLHKDFHLLAAESKDGSLFERCATKHQVRSCMQGGQNESLWGTEMHCTQAIAHWRTWFATGPTQNKIADQNLFVVANLYFVSSNLVERSLFLTIRITKSGDDLGPERKSPKWWLYK